MKIFIFFIFFFLFSNFFILSQSKIQTSDTTSKKIILTEKAPKPIGPYSQAVELDGFLFISGQIAIEPKTNQLITKSIEDETKQVLENIKAIVEKAGYDMSDIVKTTIYLTDLNDFQKVNEVYAEYFSEKPPARETVQVQRLPKNAKIEISAIAIKKSK